MAHTQHDLHLHVCVCVLRNIQQMQCKWRENGRIHKNSHWNLNEPKITQHLPHFFLNFRWTNSKFELTGHSTWTFFFSYTYQPLDANTVFIKGSLYSVFFSRMVFFLFAYRVIKCFFSVFNLPLNPILFQLKQLI